MIALCIAIAAVAAALGVTCIDLLRRLAIARRLGSFDRQRAETYRQHWAEATDTQRALDSEITRLSLKLKDADARANAEWQSAINAAVGETLDYTPTPDAGRRALDGLIRRLRLRIQELEDLEGGDSRIGATSVVPASIDLLRSAYQIASRDGKETNWRAFQDRCMEEIKRAMSVTKPVGGQ